MHRTTFGSRHIPSSPLLLICLRRARKSEDGRSRKESKTSTSLWPREVQHRVVGLLTAFRRRRRVMVFWVRPIRLDMDMDIKLDLPWYGMVSYGMGSYCLLPRTTLSTNFFTGVAWIGLDWMGWDWSASTGHDMVLYGSLLFWMLTIMMTMKRMMENGRQLRLYVYVG